jgi:hypothetical protein
MLDAHWVSSSTSLNLNAHVLAGYFALCTFKFVRRELHIQRLEGLAWKHSKRAFHVLDDET